MPSPHDIPAPPETAPESQVITVVSPADGSIVDRVAVDCAETVRAKVDRLRQAQPEWEAIGARARQRWLQCFQDWILDNAQHIADVLQSETGKTRADAVVEAPAVADLIKYWAGRAERFLADQCAAPHSPLFAIKTLRTNYRPYPVVGVISPWNFPFAAPAMDSIPALCAGAAVLVKPSEITPLSAIGLLRGWEEIGAPAVFASAMGRADTGAAVVDNVDYVQFTGSTRTGRRIAVRCAERLIPYSLELGGKDPAIVLDDADIDRAVNGITWGALVNSGQVCTSIERVYVEAPIYDEFVDKLTSKVLLLRQGRDDRTFSYDVGAMATIAQRDLVAKHIDDAVTAGARAITGGKASGAGTFFEPTVLVDIDHSMACIREETFGPPFPSSRSPTSAKPSGWQTIQITHCRRQCGPPTATADAGSPDKSKPERSTSTTSWLTHSASPFPWAVGRNLGSAAGSVADPDCSNTVASRRLHHPGFVRDPMKSCGTRPVAEASASPPRSCAPPPRAVCDGSG
jgi:acyl-CoA reductase-like NAD-dependent aldehyde dehydrogenase